MMRATGLEASCHCGTVKVTISHQPEYLQDCNCSLCSKSGGVWGYFTTMDVTISGETRSYTRNDYPQPAVEIHFCNNCGSTTHWVLTEEYVASSGNNDRMGTNMRLFDSDDLVGIELRFADGKNWTGETEFGYRRPSVVLGDDYVF